MKLTQAIISNPYVLHALRAKVIDRVLTIELTSAIQLVIPISALGALWTKASNKQLAAVEYSAAARSYGGRASMRGSF
jgi:hypothetical protein